MRTSDIVLQVDFPVCENTHLASCRSSCVNSPCMYGRAHIQCEFNVNTAWTAHGTHLQSSIESQRAYFSRCVLRLNILWASSKRMLLSRKCSDSLRLNYNRATVSNILTASNMHFPVSTYPSVAHCHTAEWGEKMKWSRQHSFVFEKKICIVPSKFIIIIPNINIKLQAFLPNSRSSTTICSWNTIF